LTNAGDQYGSWNNLLPFRIKNSTGDVYLGENLEVAKKVRCQNARQHVSAKNVIQTTSSKYLTMDKMNLTIETANNPVLVLFKVPTVSSTKRRSWCIFQLLVDNKVVAESRCYTSTVVTHEVTLTWMGVLSDEKHTIKGQWRMDDTGFGMDTVFGMGNSITACSNNATRHLIAIEL
jgi:hypothetical protein